MTRNWRASARGVAVFGLLLGSPGVLAAEIDWAPYGAWVQDAVAGSIPFKSGRIDIRVLGGDILTKGWVVNTFATTSPDYANIDTATHHVLEIRPAVAHLDWSVEFDLVGTTLTPSDVFTAGQLAVASSGIRLTDLAITLYAPDDQTVLDPRLLDFEQHALISANFDARLAWDPLRGTLQPIKEGVSKNSGWAFFSPTGIDIGKIVIRADATGGPHAVNFSFGTARGAPEDGGPHLTIAPATGKYLVSQRFDLLLLLERAQGSAIGGSARLDGVDVTSAVAACARAGRLDQGDAYFRCPGISGQDLGIGTHSFDVEIALDDGTVLRDAVVWTVVESREF